MNRAARLLYPGCKRSGNACLRFPDALYIFFHALLNALPFCDLVSGLMQGCLQFANPQVVVRFRVSLSARQSKFRDQLFRDDLQLTFLIFCVFLCVYGGVLCGLILSLTMK